MNGTRLGTAGRGRVGDRVWEVRARSPGLFCCPALAPPLRWARLWFSPQHPPASVPGVCLFAVSALGRSPGGSGHCLLGSRLHPDPIPTQWAHSECLPTGASLGSDGLGPQVRTPEAEALLLPPLSAPVWEGGIPSTGVSRGLLPAVPSTGSGQAPCSQEAGILASGEGVTHGSGHGEQSAGARLLCVYFLLK